MNPRRVAVGLVALLALPLVANGVAGLAELAWYGSLYRNGRPAALYPDDPSAPRLLPGGEVDGLGLQVHVNAYGLRGPEPRDPKPATRIWVLGGSSTYDVHATQDSQTWPAQLEARLGDQVEVLNGGRPGEVLMGSWDQLRAHHAALDPDVVLLYHGPNDIRQALKMQLGSHVELICDQDILPPVDIALFRWVERLPQSAPPLPPEWSQRRLARWDDIERELREVLRQTRAMGMRGVVVSHGLWSEDQEGMGIYAAHMGMGPEGIAQAYQDYNALTARVALSEGAIFIDLATMMPRREEMWGDPSHFSPTGSAEAGRLVAESLRELGLVD